MVITYRDAGVDIEAGAELVRRIKPLVGKTRRPEVLSDLGGFGGLCGLPAGIRDPVLVAGADGVGTKLKVAQQAGKHESVGIDLVAMCANDIATVGAEPLFFLDYFVCGRLDVTVAESVVAGIAEGCRQAGCALLGGETAEHPGDYDEGVYELAGFCVGVVERAKLIDGSRIEAGDTLFGLASSGLHSNGYSLARKVLQTDEVTLAELLTPTQIYIDVIRALVSGCDVRGIAHITGGGLTENVPRMLPSDSPLKTQLDHVWPVAPIFGRLQKAAALDDAQMRMTFNMGVGMVVCIPAGQVETALRMSGEAGVAGFVVGRVVA